MELEQNIRLVKERIAAACDQILGGGAEKEFPLRVWQTGSGTQTNMNVNEVIAHLAAEQGCPLHPNDDVNCSQSSNDTFPTAMSIAAVKAVKEQLLPALLVMEKELHRLESENESYIKLGRTHLQDATPIRFSQEISGWAAMLYESKQMLEMALAPLAKLAIGGTAVGTGLNAPQGFDQQVCNELNRLTDLDFQPNPNKFHALTSKDAFVFAHGAMKALAANLMKIANDVRWLASGPRCGLGEIFIPENEPGSSIMPGKVNPVIPELVNQICYSVIGNDLTVTFAAEAGQLQLNAMEPVIVHSMLMSIRMLLKGLTRLRVLCVDGITANEGHCKELVLGSIGIATALNPVIGFETSDRIARRALKENRSIYDLVLEEKLISKEELAELLRPEKMIAPHLIKSKRRF